MFSMYYDEAKKRQVIIKTEEYQVEKVNEFIWSLPALVNYAGDNSKQYTVMQNDDNVTPIIFTINTFNYINLGLKSEYKDFFELTMQGQVELGEEKGTMFIISPNEEKLRGFCGWINRLTT